MTDSSWQRSKWRLWLWWTLATAAGMTVSSSVLALAFRGMGLISPLFTTLLGAGHFGYSINLLSHAVVGGIIGTGLGLAQYLVLRQRIQQAKQWVLTSAVSIAIGNLLSLPAFSLADSIVYGDLYVPRPFPYFAPVGAVAISTMTAAVAGTAIGIAQWLFLRRRIRRAGWWVLVSALAWGVGVIPGYFGGMTISNIEWVPAWGWLEVGDQFLYTWEGIGLPIIGVVIGAITGLVLAILLGERAPGVASASETAGGISQFSGR